MTEPAQAEGLNEAQEPTLVGQVLSERYRIDAVLGEGGMGAVYRAEHLLMHKRVAIKVLHPEMTRMPEVVQRFEREAMAAANIDHPHVATAYDFGKLASGAFFLVLEYVEGKSLRDVILEEGSLSVERSVYITRQVLQALARAHGMGIVHRDLKPENVMLVERDGDPDFVKVLDFGIAKVPVGEMSRGQSTAALTQLGMVYGTPEYMAPEQALGQDVDARADLYALGVLLFEMLSGKRPFDAANPVQILGMVVSLPVPAFATVCPDHSIPPGIEEVTRKLLAKLADDRYPDAKSAIMALDAACPPVPLSVTGERMPSGDQPIRGRTTHGSLVGLPNPDGSSSRLSALPPLPPNARPTKLAVLGVALALGIAMLLVLVVLQRGGSQPITVVETKPSTSASAVGSVEIAPEPTAVSEAEIQAASSKGIEALEALKTKFPRDAGVLRALAKAQSEKQLQEATLTTLNELFMIDATTASDRALQTLVVQAAMSGTAAQNTAFDLMENKMGAGGPDALYSLLVDARSGANAKLQKRGRDLFAKKDFLARATPALVSALDLRNAGGALCSQHRKLFQQAKDQGDARSMRYLSPLTSTRGCGFLKRGDCYACLRSDNLLNEAIKAVGDRDKSAGKEP